MVVSGSVFNLSAQQFDQCGTCSLFEDIQGTSSACSLKLATTFPEAACKNYIKHAPVVPQHTPVKVIRLVLHVVQQDAGLPPRNFEENNPDHTAWIDYMMLQLNVIYRNLVPVIPAVPACPSEHIMLSRIQFELEQIFYHHIGAVWYHNENPFFLLPGHVWQHYRAESVADTVVLGRNCRKIVKNMAVICTSFDTVMLVHQHGDTVFLYDARLNDFQVLYNFGAQPGDTWTMELLQQVSYDILMLTVRVDSVSVVNINGLDLRQQFVSFQLTDPVFTGNFYPSQSPITEKIGYHDYWLYQYSFELGPICDVPQPAGLRCYYDPEFGLYETGIAPYCDWVGANTRESLAEPEGVRIFPNPAAGVFTVENLRAKPLTFDVMDMQGRVVLRGHTAGYRTETGIGALSPGVYSVVFREDGQPVGRIRLVVAR